MEDTTHPMRSLWHTHENDEDAWGVLLVGARNAFNEGNHKLMERTARHE